MICFYRIQPFFPPAKDCLFFFSIFFSFSTRTVPRQRELKEGTICGMKIQLEWWIKQSRKPMHWPVVNREFSFKQMNLLPGPGTHCNSIDVLSLPAFKGYQHLLYF